MDRIERDTERLRADFPDLIVGNNNEYIVLPSFVLPQDLFNAECSRLLVVIPPTYPTAPPDNFYISWGLTLKDSGEINSYSGPTELYGESWGTFSFHSNGGWDTKRDSLLTFITAIRIRLHEGA